MVKKNFIYLALSLIVYIVFFAFFKNADNGSTSFGFSLWAFYVIFTLLLFATSLYLLDKIFSGTQSFLGRLFPIILPILIVYLSFIIIFN